MFEHTLKAVCYYLWSPQRKSKSNKLVFCWKRKLYPDCLKPQFVEVSLSTGLVISFDLKTTMLVCKSSLRLTNIASFRNVEVAAQQPGFRPQLPLTPWLTSGQWFNPVTSVSVSVNQSNDNCFIEMTCVEYSINVNVSYFLWLVPESLSRLCVSHIS